LATASAVVKHQHYRVKQQSRRSGVINRRGRQPWHDPDLLFYRCSSGDWLASKVERVTATMPDR